MRTKTLASLLILCGSTAAFANMTTTQETPTPNNTIENNTTAPEPATPNETAPANKTDDAPPQF